MSTKEEDLKHAVWTIRSIIADDAFAVSHQSLGQYRTALLTGIAKVMGEILLGEPTRHPALQALQQECDELGSQVEALTEPMSRVRKALTDRQINTAVDESELLRTAANIVAEDGGIIAHLSAQVEALTKPQKPVAYLAEHHAFRMSPHGQDAEGHDWLEMSDANDPKAFPVYAAPSPLTRPAVPEGWKLVPVEPTPEMVHAVRFAGDPCAPPIGAKIIAGETAFPFVGEIVAERMCLAMLAAAPQPEVQAKPFQARVQPWLMECFGAMIAGDREERNHRFLEESLELVQALGCTANEAHQLVDYTFGRPIGEPAQEVGGVMVTLAALCLANGLDMHANGETELARINAPEMVAKIRAKQAAKPKYSPLPEAQPTEAAQKGGA